MGPLALAPMTKNGDRDDAQIIAEAMSEVLNGLYRLVDPNRFGQPSDADMASLRGCLRELVDRAPEFRGWASPGVDLMVIAGTARELDAAIESSEGATDVRVQGLARRLAKEIGVDLFPQE